MNKGYLEIKDIIFRLELEDDLKTQMLKRVPAITYEGSSIDFNVDVICKRESELIFTDNKFLDQQEPDINEDSYYREILNLGIFKYDKTNKKLMVSYIISDKYLFDSLEVVVDTILQFIYLIMLEFGIVPLHTSAVAYEKKAVLLFGNSGSGKSTLELSLLNSGFSYFSDDIAFLDDENQIFGSGERILGCLNKTLEITDQIFKAKILQVENSDISRKNIVYLSDEIVSEHYKLQPIIIVFPQRSENIKEPLIKLNSGQVWTELIKITISKQFSSEQKQLYMKRLKNLALATTAYYYYWNENEENQIKRVCETIRTICKETTS